MLSPPSTKTTSASSSATHRTHRRVWSWNAKSEPESTNVRREASNSPSMRSRTGRPVVRAGRGTSSRIGARVSAVAAIVLLPRRGKGWRTDGLAGSRGGVSESAPHGGGGGGGIPAGGGEGGGAGGGAHGGGLGGGTEGAG